MGKKKFYVVWKGRETGVYETWDDCKQQVEGFPKAVYKSFTTKDLADQAFQNSSKDYVGKNKQVNELSIEQSILVGNPIRESISVDGAWNTATGIVEYQGVDTNTGELLFHQGPFEDGTNNIVEFLAIVHGLAYCKQKELTLPIYSDSRNAISWVKDKEAGTNHKRNEKNLKLFELIDRAIKWLKSNEYPNKVLKWETKAWGENPADFGRK
ncbi:ribonuclease H1 domain-containing protein [Pontibacter oryzae]|uniref:Ribonuclease H n=1 Tax=Pontibacter oryzae TaxID=2304593 RepID=A0A399SI10_9BACT|nr:ribonuclease H family protein [Pontibacter oryzae]RIJ42651.1 ribonuclease H [Pontibacter oryzae]